MEFATSYSIPQISISPAPPEEYRPESSSPFTSLVISVQDDGFRPTHLTPPPTSTTFKRIRSPLKPVDDPKGLADDRFAALLNSSKAYSGGKRDVDLRKEIALKAHKTKQVERRALFLSKLQEPPSPTATTTPKTPPDSPAIFHYRLPSPGLVSPLALFESLGETPEGIQDGWVEQVDFRLKTLPAPHTRPSTRGVPSLAQISARFTQQVQRDTVPFPGLVAANTPPQTQTQVHTRPSVGVGRLRMPLRAPPPKPPVVQGPVYGAQQQQPLCQRVGEAQPQCMPSTAPRTDALPEIRITTLVVPRTRSASPVELSERNLLAFNSHEQTRDQRASDMLCKLRRRTLSSECLLALAPAPPVQRRDDVDYKWRRRSAPADIMPLRARTGFEHPVLALPGGF